MEATALDLDTRLHSQQEGQSHPRELRKRCEALLLVVRRSSSSLQSASLLPADPRGRECAAEFDSVQLEASDEF